MTPLIDTALARRTDAAHPTLAAVLLFDAATCAAMGVTLLALTLPLAALLGLPATLLTIAGALLLACALLMGVAARQQPPATTLVPLIVIGNLAWALASAYVAFTVAGITALGQVFVLAQAVAVIVLAWLEWRGLAAHGKRGRAVQRDDSTPGSPGERELARRAPLKRED